MENPQGRLGNTDEIPVGEMSSLRWRPGLMEPVFLDLSPEGELHYVSALLQAEISDGKRSKDERTRERWRLQREAGRLLPGERVCQCCRAVINGATVAVVRSKDTGRACFKNLRYCGSLWTCPVCAAKITERRRKELQDGLTIWHDRGGMVFMLTLTIPHWWGQNTGALCDQLLKAQEKLKNRTFWRQWKKRIGYVGAIRALEVNYGPNGAHAHIHVLLFCMPTPLTEVPTAANFLPHWQSACVSVGLPTPNEHGVDIRRGDYNAANYIGKWGLHDEMTKSHVKRGKGSENKTAFDLLRASLSGDVSAGEKFREHAAAFSGRRQLVWTRGLRELLSLGVEKSDAETANADEGAVEEIATIGPSDWSRVLRHDMRAAVLLAAEKGAESLAILLRELSFFDSRMKRCFAWRN